MKEILFAMLGSIAVLYSPIAPLLIVIGAAIMLDTIVAIARTIILKQKFTSFKLSRLIFKMFFYESVILMLFLLDNYLIGHDILGYEFFLTKLGALLLIFVEALSIDESVRMLNKNKGFSHYFYKLINTIKKGKEVLIETKKNLK